MTTPRRVSTVACLTLLLAGLCAGQSSAVTLTFEGLADSEPILNYYNGGVGGMGSGPGPAYGITFGSASLALISREAGGSGDFEHHPGGNTVASFLLEGTSIMNVPKGFTTGLSFYYAAAYYPGVVRVYDGLNATGNVLAALSLPVTGEYCGSSPYAYSCWRLMGIAFRGLAHSVDFSGVANQIGFDNITVGSDQPPVLKTVTPGSAQMNAAAFTMRVNGSNFQTGCRVRWTGPAGDPVDLTTSFVAAFELQATLTSRLLTTPGTAELVVVNPDGAMSNALAFTILPQPPSNLQIETTGGTLPTDQRSIRLRLDSAAGAEYQATLGLSFTPDNVAGWETGLMDPAVRFPNGQTTMTVVIPMGATAVDAAASVQPGTVAGTLTVAVTSITVAGVPFPLSPAPQTTIRIDRLAPAIVANGVRFVDVTDTGFSVEVTGYSTTRELTAASLAFTAAGGATIDSGASHTIQLGTPAATWFASSEGRNNGSRFTVTIPFTLTVTNGNSTALGSVAVRLSNSMGQSNTVSANR